MAISLIVCPRNQSKLSPSPLFYNSLVALQLDSSKLFTATPTCLFEIKTWSLLERESRICKGVWEDLYSIQNQGTHERDLFIFEFFYKRKTSVPCKSLKIKMYLSNLQNIYLYKRETSFSFLAGFL